MEFRELRADEIDARVQQIGKGEKKAYCLILLYKDARCDMNILDETVGVENWQRTHKSIGNSLFCEVGIYDEKKQSWIWKEDVGTASNMEAEKGQASDSFKRACFNLGIGRELYTAPKIVISLNQNEISDVKGKLKLKNRIKFSVSRIEYENRKIKCLEIVDQDGQIRWSNYTTDK